MTLFQTMYNDLTSWNNLLLAYKRASAGKRGHPNVAAFEYRLEDNFLQLAHRQFNEPVLSQCFSLAILCLSFNERIVNFLLCFRKPQKTGFYNFSIFIMRSNNMSNSLLDRIEINPQIMLGKPVIKGTRITVEIILKKLSQNISFEEILSDYPRLKREDIQAAIAYAATALSTDELLPLEAAA
jgi:uncharacterized protein (DUF433 family)